MRAGKKLKLEVNDEAESSTRNRKKRDIYLHNVRTLKESALSKTCRICLTREGEMKQIHLFDNRVDMQFANKIMACTNVKISLGDGLPEQICVSCVKAVNNAYSLKEMCEESNILLYRLFKKDPLIEMTKNADYDKIIEHNSQKTDQSSVGNNNNKMISILKNTLNHGSGSAKNSPYMQQNVSLLNSSNYNFNNNLKENSNTTKTNTSHAIQQNLYNSYALICYNNPMIVSDYKTTEFSNNNSQLHNRINANKNSLILLKPTESSASWNIPSINLNNHVLSSNNILTINGLQVPHELKKTSHLYNDISSAQISSNAAIRTESNNQSPIHANLTQIKTSSINNNVPEPETDFQQGCFKEKIEEADISCFLKSEIEIKEEPITFEETEKNIPQPISQVLPTIPSQSIPVHTNVSKQMNKVLPRKTFCGEYLLSTRRTLDTLKKKSLQDEEDSTSLYACEICGKKLSNPIAVRNHITWTHTIS